MTKIETLTTALALVSALASVPSEAANKITGKATVYSHRFEGRKTATGETFHSQSMTAASNRFPLGSKVLVRNRKTGQHAVVRINDRPSHNARTSVDLSPAAARKAGVHGTGTVEATLIHR